MLNTGKFFGKRKRKIPTQLVLWNNFEKLIRSDLALQFNFNELKKKFCKMSPNISISTKRRYIEWLFYKQLNDWEIKENRFGLGLYARRNFKLEEETKSDFICLFGTLDFDYVYYKEHTQKSSFELDGAIVPVYSLISIVNNLCGSKLKFTQFGQSLSTELKNELKDKYNYEKGPKLNSKIIFITSYYSVYELKKGEELFVEYKNAPKGCICIKCSRLNERKKLGKRIPKLRTDSKYEKDY